ncbi:hypothetical protein CR513_30034, partial [Mucuna pruriens]
MEVGVVSEPDPVRLKRKTLEAVLEQCQRALELLNASDEEEEENDSEQSRNNSFFFLILLKFLISQSVRLSVLGYSVYLFASFAFITWHSVCPMQLCDLLKSRVECPDFLEKLECAQASVSHKTGMNSVQIMLMKEKYLDYDRRSKNDLWEGEDVDSDQEDYVLVRQEDIVEGIACYMAAYLLSLKQTKDLTPNQLQDALSKTFSAKKKKGKLRKAWDGSKVIYNVASWGATAIGIYQNPVIARVATKAFWTSCQVISKLL